MLTGQTTALRGKTSTHSHGLKVEMLAIGLFLALAAIRLAFPGIQLPPAVAVTLTFLAVFIFPGLLLTALLPSLRRSDWLKRLAYSFVLGYALWAIPSYVILSLHSTWAVFIAVYLAVNGALIVAYGLREWLDRRHPVPAQLDEAPASDWKKPGTLLLLVLLLLTLASLVPLTSNGDLDGDVLTHIAMIRSVLDADHMNVVEPLFGAGLPVPTRGAANPWLLLPAFLSRVSGVDPIPLINTYLPPLMAMLAVLSLYTLVYEFGGNRNMALLAAIFMVVFLASDPYHRHGNLSYLLFRRIISDKFFLLMICMPVGLTFVRRFLVGRQKRFLLLAGFVGLGIVLTHALIALFYVISLSFFTAAYYFLVGLWRKPALEGENAAPAASGGRLRRLARSPRIRLTGRVAALALLSVFLLAIPVWQQRQVSDKSSYLFMDSFDEVPLVQANSLILPSASIPSLYLPGSRVPTISELAPNTDNPFLIRRLYSQIKAQGLLLLSPNRYMSHPDLLRDWGTLLALALTPFLLIWVRRDNLALFLFVTTVGYLAINFNPYVAPIVGRFVTPWLIYRFTWPLPIHIIPAFFLFKLIGGGGQWLAAKAGRAALQTAAGVLPAVALLAVVAGLWPRIQVYTGELMHETSPISLLSPGLIAYVQDHVAGDDAVILAEYETNQLFAALFNKPDLVAHRYNTTSEEFPADRQDEALQRSLDVDHFTAARLAGQDLLDMVDRYNIKYVLIGQQNGLACQLPYLPSLFEPLYADSEYQLYQVKRPLATSPVIEGNTDLLAGQEQQAAAAFRRALAADPTAQLARLGLGEALIEQGQPQAALSQLQAAAQAQPNNLCVLKQLAQGYFEADQLDQAAATYQQAVQADPAQGEFPTDLGDIYLLEGRTTEAQTAYQQAAALQADPGTADYYRSLAQRFQAKAWYDAALEPARQLVALDPAAANTLLAGNIAAAAGNTTEAIGYYRQAIQADPAGEVAYTALGNLYLDNKEYDQALATYQQAIRRGFLNLDWALTARMQVGAVYEAQGDLDRALQAYQDTARVLPSSAEPYLAIGHIHELRSQWADAEAAYQKAAQVDPLNADPHLRLGDLLKKTGQTRRGPGRVPACRRRRSQLVPGLDRPGPGAARPGRPRRRPRSLPAIHRRQPDQRRGLRRPGQHLPEPRPARGRHRQLPQGHRPGPHLGLGLHLPGQRLPRPGQPGIGSRALPTLHRRGCQLRQCLRQTGRHPLAPGRL